MLLRGSRFGVSAQEVMVWAVEAARSVVGNVSGHVALLAVLGGEARARAGVMHRSLDRMPAGERPLPDIEVFLARGGVPEDLGDGFELCVGERDRRAAETAGTMPCGACS